MVRIALVIGLSCCSIAWSQETIRDEGVAVRYSGIGDDYANAIARTVSAARTAAIEKFQFDMPETIFVEVMADDSRKVRLFNDGHDRFSLTVRTEKDLAQPASSGTFHIYGLCHEVGHLAMYRPIRDHSWLSYEAAEGWAHYLGSRLVDEVFEKQGEDLWPDQYDYRADGTPRLRRQFGSDNASPVTACAAHWQVMAELAGDDQLANLFAQWGKTKVNPEMPGRALKPILQSMPQAEALGSWWDKVEAEFVVKRSRSGFAAETMKADQLDGDPRELAHDDGEQTGKKSIAGSGHAVIFESASGSPSYLTGVRIYGSRYGSQRAPREDFRVWLCDEDFNEITEFQFPYSKFQRGNPEWLDLATKPTKVPSRFIVCVGFNPTGTKGVFVGYDNEGSGNSLNGLPGREPAEFDNGDWLMRVTLESVKHDFALTDDFADNADASTTRTWTDATGNFSVTAMLVSVDGENVQLKKSDGTVITVPLKQLSEKDRDHLKGKSP